VFEIGNTLREARLRRGLDIAECEAETKIRGKYLRAMEEEHFDVLPAPTYVRGFLRAYAEFLELDGRLVLDEYDSRFGVPRDPREEEPLEARLSRAGVPPGRTAEPRGGNDRRRRRGGDRRSRRRRTETQLLWLAIGGVLAVALLVWLGVGDSSNRPTSIPTTPPSTRATNPAAAAAVPPAKKPKKVKPMEIVLTGTGVNGSWVQVHGRNAEGPIVYEGTLVPGETATFRVKRSIYVEAGNSAELVTSVDGKQRTLESGVGSFLVTRRGPVQLAQK
jgi:cytoskeleton protein RodZ